MQVSSVEQVMLYPVPDLKETSLGLGPRDVVPGLVVVV
jgi:hypothetical protein